MLARKYETIVHFYLGFADKKEFCVTKQRSQKNIFIIDTIRTLPFKN
jgi:hypothetical protein